MIFKKKLKKEEKNKQLFFIYNDFFIKKYKMLSTIKLFEFLICIVHTKDHFLDFQRIRQIHFYFIFKFTLNQKEEETERFLSISLLEVNILNILEIWVDMFSDSLNLIIIKS